MKRAVLFDLDGTLVGLKPYGRLAVLQRALSHFGVSGITQDQADRFWYSAERYTMLKKWSIQAEEFWPRLDSTELLYLQMQHTFCYRDVKIVSYLAGRGLELGLVSNSAHVSILGKLELLRPHFQPSSLRQVVSCSEDTPLPKPHPHGILYALAKLEVAPHEVLMVGDSMDDVRAAHAAGVEVAIVNRGAPIQFDSAYSYHRLNSLWELKTLFASELATSGYRHSSGKLVGYYPKNRPEIILGEELAS
ncbi:MAG: HAD family hydrolase [Chloroflexota bacterium]|nr:HAD family hydrolase [Chloroflexota bacterium]